MPNHQHSDSQATHRDRRGGRAKSWAFFGFLAIGAFFLLAEHRAHLAGWLPFMLLALCPLIHLFHGHGGHGGGSGGANPDRDAPQSPQPPGHRH